MGQVTRKEAMKICDETLERAEREQAAEIDAETWGNDYTCPECEKYRKMLERIEGEVARSIRATKSALEQLETRHRLILTELKGGEHP